MTGAAQAPAIQAPATQRDPGFYDYLPYNDRPVIKWPNGARVAFWVAPNVEFYELNPPRNPARAPWARPAPDVLNYSYRDYGNRTGFWRMLDVMKRCNMRGSVSLNVAMCEHHPEVIKACADEGWEFYSHGTYNTKRKSVRSFKIPSTPFTNTQAKNWTAGWRPRSPTRPTPWTWWPTWA